MSLAKKAVIGAFALAAAVAAPIVWHEINVCGDAKIQNELKKGLVQKAEKYKPEIIRSSYLQAQAESRNQVEQGINAARVGLTEVVLDKETFKSRASAAWETGKGILGFALRTGYNTVAEKIGSQSRWKSNTPVFSLPKQNYATLDDRIELAKLKADLILAEIFYSNDTKVVLNCDATKITENLGTLDYLANSPEDLREIAITEAMKSMTVTITYKDRKLVSFCLDQGNSPVNISYGKVKEDIAKKIHKAVEHIVRNNTMKIEDYRKARKVFEQALYAKIDGGQK